ncbi:hypothetical protein RHGRI_010389 [Rhododendron griersonianum]|uniref:Uncharacterized protein n=1 Tax=Rhododendron griersonianum TaxID=479676 RepID=A0AAV6KIB4_9ERIC|nr:hypothetical protein RHGRI_010389 [Rhododendron griersonianum]
MSKFFRTLALSPWNDIVDPPYSDPQGAPIFDDKGRLVGIFAFTLRRMSFSIPIGVVKEYLEMTIPKRVLDKFSPSALQIDGVMRTSWRYIRKVGDETVWPTVCLAKDPKRGLALLKVEVKEGDEFCILSQEEWILPGKKIFCLSQLSGMPFSFECGEVSYPHLASGEKGKSSQNRTVDDVKSMWDDGGLRKHLMMADNKSSNLVSMDGNIPLLQMSKFTGSLALMNFNITEEAR